MELSVLAIIISLVVGVITIFSVIWRGGGLAKEVQILVKRHELCPINKLALDIEGIKKQNEMFWVVLTPHLASAIHSPVHKRRDELMDKLVENKITHEELIELEPMLCQEAWNGDKDKKVFAGMMHFRVKVLLTEVKHDGHF